MSNSVTASANPLRAFIALLLREGRAVAANRWDFSLITWMPLAMMAVLLWMFMYSAMRELPTVIVDADHSALSRNLTRHLEAATAIFPVAVVGGFEEGRAMVRRGDAYAMVYIPAGAQADALRGKQATIYAFANESFYTAGSFAGRDVANAVSQLGHDIFAARLEDNRAVGIESNAALPPLAVQTTILFNPEYSYQWGLLSAVIPGLLHLMMVCAVAVSLHREYPPAARRQWLDAAGGVSFGLAAKLFFYAAIFALHGLIMLALFAWCGFGVKGSIALTVFAQGVMHFAYASGMSLVFALTHGNLLQTLSAASIYTSPAITFGDILFPINETSTLFARIYNVFLPYSSYIQLQAQQMQMGVPLADSLPFLLHLLIYAAIAFPLAAWALSSAFAFAEGEETKAVPAPEAPVEP